MVHNPTAISYLGPIPIHVPELPMADNLGSKKDSTITTEETDSTNRPPWGFQILKATLLTASSLGLGWLTTGFWSARKPTNEIRKDNTLTIYDGKSIYEIPSRSMNLTGDNQLQFGKTSPTSFDKLGIVYRNVIQQHNVDESSHQDSQRLSKEKKGLLGKEEL